MVALKAYTPLEADLVDLNTDHFYRGVDWQYTLFDRHPDTIYFHSFSRAGAPKGSGREALQELLDVAREYHMRVCLHVDTRRDKVVNLYKSLGFKEVSESEDLPYNSYFADMSYVPMVWEG